MWDLVDLEEQERDLDLAHWRELFQDLFLDRQLDAAVVISLCTQFECWFVPILQQCSKQSK